jgi:YggT family protein
MLIILHYVFNLYTILLAVRLIASWFPALHGQAWLYWLSRVTDPYLNLFRRIIPPIGGVLDLSPILAFLTLQLLEMGLTFLFRYA